MPHFNRPELAVFHNLLTSIGGKVQAPHFPCTASFHLETSPTDEVQIDLQEDDGLNLTLWMFPEDTFRDATPEQMAALVAHWLRDTAAKLEAVAGERG